MAIRDLCKKKWQFAFGMPELIKEQRDVWIDDFVQRICYAMECRLAIKKTLSNNQSGCLQGFKDVPKRIRTSDLQFRKLDGMSSICQRIVMTGLRRFL